MKSSSCLCHTFLNRQTELIAAEHAFVFNKLMATSSGRNMSRSPIRICIHDLDAMAAAITADTRLVFIANPTIPRVTMGGSGGHRPVHGPACRRR